ncbi:hypothetical protein RJ640_009954 [Escallonia rubra]|uniref:S-protein homolog n=1 Tax=Escallonia rubra TaxID=112253 RepID=A0AA88QVY5_9ASTE|nr:hypothetical protein RJ640_009954 [Escallonia rubra]
MPYAIRTLYLFLVLACCLFCTVGAAKKAEVHAVNLLPDNSPTLTVHCQSKDDDLGYQTLHSGDDFQWSFEPHIFPFLNTLFFCHFWWNSHDRAFTVYDQFKLDYKCARENYLPATCYCPLREYGDSADSPPVPRDRRLSTAPARRSSQPTAAIVKLLQQIGAVAGVNINGRHNQRKTFQNKKKQRRG